MFEFNNIRPVVLTLVFSTASQNQTISNFCRRFKSRPDHSQYAIHAAVTYEIAGKYEIAGFKKI
jgi:hypothetical protein